jgi:hypothetical protein
MYLSFFGISRATERRQCSRLPSLRTATIDSDVPGQNYVVEALSSCVHCHACLHDLATFELSFFPVLGSISLF